jgi:hypothetical protein
MADAAMHSRHLAARTGAGYRCVPRFGDVAAEEWWMTTHYGASQQGKGSEQEAS